MVLRRGRAASRSEESLVDLVGRSATEIGAGSYSEVSDLGVRAALSPAT